LVALCRAGLATPAGIEKEKLQNQPVRRGKPRLHKAAASRRTPNFFAAGLSQAEKKNHGIHGKFYCADLIVRRRTTSVCSVFSGLPRNFADLTSVSFQHKSETRANP
jgi:hypothetical protein